MDRITKMPDFLVEMLEKQYGKELTSLILKGYQAKRKTTLRVNTIKTTTEKVKEELKKEKIAFEEVAWNKDGIILLQADENDIRKLRMYDNGEIYLQSLSSMLPPMILAPREGENILDMAAAPGSKTTQLAAMTNNNCMITACEMNKVRAERLKYNLEKQGVTCSYVMVADARRLDDFFSFDKILLDAPCSGSGTLSETNKKIEKNFTMKLIQKSVEAQTVLLKKAIRLLKPGKEMVYSTCSILENENEEVLKKALKEANVEVVPIDLQRDLNSYCKKDSNELPLLPVKIPGTVCVCPNELFEGFFIAKIKKRG